MKKFKSLSIIMIATMSMISCATEKTPNKGVHLEDASIDKYYNVEIPDSLKSPMLENEGYSLHNSAKVIWPASIDGTVPTDLQREILLTAFDDSVSTTLNEALESFSKTGYGLKKEDIKKLTETDSAKANAGEIMQSVSVEMTRANDKMLVFSIFIQNNFAGAAHGMYSAWFVTYDRIGKNVVTLDKLFTDKEKLRKLLESQRRKDLKEQGIDYDDYMIDKFPISESFCIEGSNISFTYQPYDIASYAEGMQTVSLSYYDMNQAGILTPYAKKLLE